MASELFEVAIGGNEGSVLLQSECGGNTVHIGNLVPGLQFSCFEGLREINLDDLNRQALKTGDGFTCSFLPRFLPREIENFCKVQDRDIKPQLPADGIRQ